MGQINTKEHIRKQERHIIANVRQIERLKSQEEKQIQKLERKIRQQAGSNNMPEVRNLAKQIAYKRKHLAKMNGVISSLEAVRIQISEIPANLAIHDAMRSTTGILSKVSGRHPTQKIARESAVFEREVEKLNIAFELVNDVVNEPLEDQEAEEELIKGVLDSLAIKYEMDFKSAPSAGVNSEWKELYKRLDDLNDAS